MPLQLRITQITSRHRYEQYYTRSHADISSALAQVRVKGMIRVSTRLIWKP
jgi:hypothetical protein